MKAQRAKKKELNDVGPWKKYLKSLDAKQIKYDKYILAIENKIAIVRLVHALKRAKPRTLLKNDSFFHEYFTPMQTLCEKFVLNDPAMPEEFRKMANMIVPEE